MADPVELKQYFSSPVFMRKRVDGFADHRDRLRAFIMQLRKDTPGENRSNVNGWHSQYDLHLVDHPALRWILGQVADAAKESFRLVQPNAAFVPKIVALWANVNEAGSYNAPHAHPAHLLSGVFYVDVDPVLAGNKKHERGGSISFQAPFPHLALYGQSPSIRYRPQDGMMLLFPGYLVHTVHPHNREYARISMAFNIDAGAVPSNMRTQTAP